MFKEGNDKMILLIDDQDSIRQIVKACLESFSDWQTTIAASGQEGFEAIATTKPDAILLDIQMPNMDGFAFLKKLQADPELAEIPIVLLTSRYDFSEPHRYSQIGAIGSIIKPFDPITIVPRLASILGWQLQSS
jgi:CheY-like chemotaxis protein